MAVILGVVAGFLGSALELGKCFAEPIKRQFNYLCCFNSNILNLTDEARRLEDTRSGLQMKVDAEENNAQIVVPGVKTWFNDVVGIQAKNTEIEAEITTFRQNGCFAIKSRFSLGKKVKKTAEAMKDLREEGSNFTIIAQPPPPAAVAAPIPLGSNIFEFDSRKQIEEEIIVSLKDENVNKLGICGMGGVGKTTMAKRIMHRVREEHLFDEIVMAVVSQKPDMLAIQGVIAKKLGLELKDKETVECRAVDLHARLTAGTKRSLIVLDDVWDVLNLEELGIPCHSGCKILLTSRDRNILKGMDVEKVPAVRVLSETEAWDLFKSKAGSCIEQENVINAVAQEVVKECKGLPIALVTVGVALKDEVDIRGWNHALDQLKSANPNHLSKVIEDVYKPLRFSYESLESVDHKSLFLLCCLFPEDYNIDLEDLAIYAMGLRMFRDIRSLEGAREAVFFLVERLKSCFLLLEGDSYYENHVKMHDVVRDVARFIASDERRINCDDCTWIASYDEEKFGLHMGSAVYPNLHLLLIRSRSDKELEIGDDFFEGMGELNVFSIRNSSLRRLPKTIKLMENLKTLILLWCESLESISVIGELVNLEILICRYCQSIECLPIEMEGISRLRLLELSGCRNLKTIAPGIISNHKGLEELIVEDFDNWEAADEESKERKNASLSELEHLSSLSGLKIQIKNSRLAAGHKLPANMVKYNITIGDHNAMYLNVSGEFKKNALMKLTTLPGNNSLGKWIHECVRIVEYMRLERSDDSTLDFGAAHNMRSLVLKKCSAVKKLVNMRSSSSATVFPLLESLELEELSELEVICDVDGPMQSNSFQNLKKLQLIGLRALKHLWNSGISPNQHNVISSFNKLSIVYISECHGLRSLFSLSMMARGSLFVQLESLEICECDMIEQVLLWNEEENQTNIHIPLVFPKLKKLKIIYLPRLTSFSKGIFQSIDFPLLEEMDVRNCPLLKGLVSSVHSDDHDDVSNIQFFSK
ncbi:hypothetical protein C2S51_003271, partial [Perilla frutescens var. frutescens]